MPLWAVIVVVVVALVVLMVGAGMVINARRRREQEGSFHAEVALANRALAAAHADDKGWDRTTLEAAARAAVADSRPGVEISSLNLVEVIDRPGIEEDKAVFVAQTAGGELRLELGRKAEGWIAERIA